MKKEEGKNENIENHIEKRQEEMTKKRKNNILHLHFL
jgi:hypothetical protein